MLCFPNCKINLGLYVTRRREDGYHDLETVFYPVPVNTIIACGPQSPLQDVLEIVPSAPGHETKMQLSGLEVAGDNENNLVWKAWRLLDEAFPGKIPALDIYIHKAIPMGAGLGGGSADGAFMLRLLNDQFQLGLTKPQLAAYALLLGSDCPFFVYNNPQFATGRGEHMTEIAVDLSRYHIEVVCPPVHVSTGQAFAMMTPRPAPYDLRLLPNLPLEQWKEHISNDFEVPVFLQHPELAAIKQQLYDRGAIYASMSGSGSALYGIFPNS